MGGRNEAPSHTVVAFSALAVLGATWLGSQLGNLLRFPDTGSAIVFPPYAVLATALLLTPPRRWWIYLLASLVGHTLTAPLRHAGVAFVASTEIANAARALVAAVAWRRLRHGRPRFDTLEATGLFLAIAALLAPAVGAFVGTAVVVLHGRAGPGPNPYWRIWGPWFLSNAIVGVTLLPLLLVAAKRAVFWRHRLSTARVAEISLLTVGLVVVSLTALVTGGGSVAGLPMLLYAPLPFLLWAATRFGPGATSASLSVVAAAAIVGVTNSSGPFASSPTDDSVLSLYLFLMSVSLPCLLLAALVHEREQVLAALSAGQQRYRMATTAAAVGVWDWSVLSGDLYADHVLKASLGYADEEIHNHMEDWWRHVHPDDVERLGATIRAYLEGRTQSFESEHRMVHRNGSVRWFLLRGAAVRDSHGQPVRLIGTSTDVTERKCAQDALREGEERIALAATSANLGFWVWNLQTEVPWLSDHAKRLCGLSSADEPTLEQLASLVHVEDREHVREVCASALERRAPAEGELRIVRENGETRWLSVKGRFDGDGSGAHGEVVGVVIDVTERKEAELELQVRRRELAHLSRVATVGQLSGALAHELRQPLTAILSNSQTAQRLLKREHPDLAEVRTILQDIERDDARAGEVIRRMRALLKKGEAVFEPIQLSDVVQDALDIAQADLIARGTVVVKELERGLPPVYGDRVELQQVLVNLVINACEAMADQPAGQRRLTVGTTCDDSGLIVAYVTDRGIGIKEQDLEQVFEPFVTSKREGLGIGLAICRAIAKAHHGRLWAANNPDGGASFFLALPPWKASHRAIRSQPDVAVAR